MRKERRAVGLVDDLFDDRLAYEDRGEEGNRLEISSTAAATKASPKTTAPTRKTAEISAVRKRKSEAFSWYVASRPAEVPPA